MIGKILSVNVGVPEEHVWQERVVTTAIFKTPVTKRVMLRQFNVDGDGQADLENHGGEYQAAYLYPSEHYQYWRETLGRDDLTYGQFGENFTIEGFTEHDVHIGDIFKLGGATVQITQPRIPCYKLGLRMEDESIVETFLKSLRLGFYVRILEEGEVGAGDTMERVLAARDGISIHQMSHVKFVDKSDLETAQRLSELDALAPKWRGIFKRQALFET